MQEISSVFSNGNRKFIPSGASCRPGKFKWKKMKEQKKRNVKHFDLKGVYILGGEVFYTICPVQSNVFKSCVVVRLFICSRRHQSETKLVSENNIQSVHKIYITTLFICDAIILWQARHEICQGISDTIALPLSCVSRMNAGVFWEQMCMIQYRVSLKIVFLFERP